MTDQKRINVAVTQRTRDLLKLVQDLDGINKTDAVNRLISAAGYLMEARARGDRVNIKHKDGSEMELVVL